MSFLFDVLFGCWHKNYSFPRQANPPGLTGHYVVCLDCGKEWDYDWSGMKVLGERQSTPRLGCAEWLKDAEKTLQREESRRLSTNFDSEFLKAMRVKF